MKKHFRLLSLVLAALLSVSPLVTPAIAKSKSSSSKSKSDKKDSKTVYIAGSDEGEKYHRKDCRTLRKSEKVKTTVKEAKSDGYTACKVCKP